MLEAAAGNSREFSLQVRPATAGVHDHDGLDSGFRRNDERLADNTIDKRRSVRLFKAQKSP